MNSFNIKISQLNPLGAISGQDFFPIDQSSSLTTYRTDVNALNTWFSVSGSAYYAIDSVSSSYALTSSYSPESIS